MDAQETRVYTAAIITVVLFAGIVIYFIVSIVRQQRKNIELNKQIVLAEITAIEKDRARMAYDLHDELGPILSYVKLKINLFEISETDDKVQLEKINETIDNGLARIREISYNLMPAVLLTKGLRAALLEYVNGIDDNVLDVNMIFPENIIFSEQQSINIYRIVQEVVHNTMKHANAATLDIIFKKEKNKITISLKDDGTGFEWKDISNKKGLGLKSLHSRIQLLNGKMFIETDKDRGTEFSFEIPVEI